ncbi:MAG TPA: hypothetical protein VFW33_17410 [Gemmataceae bacterium]|nr:hypothetical protein [Gemmataceae bacterium]
MMRKLLDPDRLLFLALLVLHVVPLWAFPYFPSQDGPAHLENATILRDYHSPDRSLLPRFYTLSDRFHPNWFGHLALLGLMTVMPPLVAEKVLLTGYVVLLPLGLRYALDGVRAGAGWLAVLAFPLLHHFLYHMGFYNFVWSLALFGFVVGYYLRHHERFGVRETLTLAALAALTYFCHPVGLAVAMMAVGLLALAWRPAHLTLRRRLLGPALAFVPVVALGAAFVGRQGGGAVWRHTLLSLLDDLRHLEMLVSYLNLERLFTGLYFWGLAALTAVVLWVRWRSRAFGRADWLLAVAGLTFASYLAAPTELSGGGFVEPRLALLGLLALILWLGTFPFGPWLKRTVQVVGALLALALLGLHVSAYAAFNDYLAEYMSAEPYLEANRTLLPLPFAHGLHTGDPRLDNAKVGVFRHAAGYLAARAGVIDLENYEGHSGYFPVDYRPEVDPFVQMNPQHAGQDVGLQAEPPDVDFLKYTERTGLPVDYVLLWDVRPALRDTPAGRAIFEQLADRYELIHTSPRGMMQLYRRKDLR